MKPPPFITTATIFHHKNFHLSPPLPFFTTRTTIYHHHHPLLPFLSAFSRPADRRSFQVAPVWLSPLTAAAAAAEEEEEEVEEEQQQQQEDCLRPELMVVGECWRRLVGEEEPPLRVGVEAPAQLHQRQELRGGKKHCLRS